ncbi:MAG: hypothetical protein ACKO1U_10410 [Bacteroidota bacterium]
MDTLTLNEARNIFSTIEFVNGHSAPGLIVSRFELLLGTEEFRFVPQSNMHDYKSAFEKFDRETCEKLSVKITPEQIKDIRTVSLADFKKALESEYDEEILRRNFGGAIAR